MTLVVIFDVDDENEMRALADTRTTDTNGLTTSNFAPKLFALPVKETFGDPKLGKIRRWECGFAFAGYVTAAHSVFTTAAAIMSNINLKNDRAGLSLQEVAEITKKVYQEIFFDICFRQPQFRDYIINSAVSVFGYCPIERQRKCFVIRSGYVAGPHPVVVMGENTDRPIAAILGSGKSAFEEGIKSSILRNKPASIMEVFEEVVLDRAITHVGGGVQVLQARREGVTIPPIINPTDDPDAPDFMLYGVRVDSLIDKSRCTIGYQEPGATFFGFGLRDGINRTMLSRLGFDPDSKNIDHRLKNTAAFFGAISSVWIGHAKKVRLDSEKYRLACLSPVIGKSYIGGSCPICGYFCPLIPNSDMNGIAGIFEGDSELDILCSSCFETYCLPSSVLTVKTATAKPNPLSRLLSSAYLPAERN